MEIKNWKLILIMLIICLNVYNQIPEEFAEDCCTEYHSNEQANLSSMNVNCNVLYSGDRSFDIQNIPASYFPSYTIRLNFIFLQRSDGSGNFQEDNNEHQQLIDDVIDELNLTYSSMVNPNDPSCYTGVDFVPDAKINFSVNKIFIRDNFGWNNENDDSSRDFRPGYPDWYLNYLDNQIVNDPSVPRAINIYFSVDSSLYMDMVVNQITTSYTGAEVACSQYPSMSDFNRTSKNHFPDKYLKYWYMKNICPGIFNQPWDPVIRGWYVSGLGRGLAHELGHSLNLLHACPHYPENGCFYSIMHRAGTNPRNYLPPSEVGRIHTTLMYSNIRSFIPNDFYNPYPIIIQSPETWDYNMRLYRNVSIEANASLILNCNLSLPDQGTSYIRTNGSLTINEGINLFGNNVLSVFPYANLTAADEANIMLTEPNSRIDFNTFSYIDLCDAVFSGNGRINDIYINKFLSGTITGTVTHRAWNKIQCDNLSVSNNSNIKLYPKEELIINGTFNTGTNSILEITPVCPVE